VTPAGATATAAVTPAGAAAAVVYPKP